MTKIYENSKNISNILQIGCVPWTAKMRFLKQKSLFIEP